MYFVSGSNLFGQWLTSPPIIKLQPFINFFNKTVNKFPTNHLSTTEPKLLLITWSYNIFEYNKLFYICGGWRGEANVCEVMKIPIECSQSLEPDLYFAGNNYNLMLLDLNSQTVWRHILNEEQEWKWTKVQLFLNTINNFEANSPPSKRKRIIGKIVKISMTNYSCLCLTNDGRVYEMPSEINTDHCIGRVSDVQCGYEHIAILTDMGRVYTWGNGRRCQLGHGEIQNVEEPTEVNALSGINIVKIRTGGWHTLALSDSGDLYAWGWNDTGQLGICEDPSGKCTENVVTSYVLPTIVDIYDDNGCIIDVNIKDIAAGTRHSVIVLSDNTVWTTGYNKYGQLGLCLQSEQTVNCFKKTYCSMNDCTVSCGPWSTVITVQ